MIARLNLIRIIPGGLRLWLLTRILLFKTRRAAKKASRPKPKD